MREDTVVQLRQPGSFEDDPLAEVLRLGARRLLGQAVEAEVAGFVEAYAHLTGSAGRRRIVRHGHLPEREIQTGIGPVAVRCPRVRDRGAGETGRRVFRPPLRPAVAFSQQGRAPRGLAWRASKGGIAGGNGPGLGPSPRGFIGLWPAAWRRAPPPHGLIGHRPTLATGDQRWRVPRTK